MCRPANQGGKRCAAHTRPRFNDAIKTITAATSKTARSDAQVNGMADVARHASTPTGRTEVNTLRERYERADDLPMTYYLESCVRIGREMRRIEQAREDDIRRAESATARHAASGG